MTPNFNIGQSVWNADDLVNPVTINFLCSDLCELFILHRYIFDKYNIQLIPEPFLICIVYINVIVRCGHRGICLRA